MANLATFPFDLVDVVESLDPQPDREPGYHVTDLIEASIAISKGRTPPTPEEREAEFADVPGIADFGKLWEAASRPHMEKIANRSGLRVEFIKRVTMDGIIGSVDAVLYSGFIPVAVIDSKLRFTKPGEDPRDNFKWMAQFKSYCKMTDTQTAWTPACYLGSRPPSVQSMLYSVTYSQKEIDENWQTILSTKRYLELKLAKNGEDTLAQ